MNQPTQPNQLKYRILYNSQKNERYSYFVYYLFVSYNDKFIKYYCSDNIQAVLMLETARIGNPEGSYISVINDEFYDTRLEFNTLEELREYFAEELI